MRTTCLTGAPVVLTSTVARAVGNEDLYGTWRLVRFTSRLVATGEQTDLFGKTPRGFLSYSRDGRMHAILTRDERPRPADLARMMDQERAELFKTMIAYAGTFEFDGKTVTHNLDIAWNETWTGTAQIRNVSLNGGTLCLTTNPQPRSMDGELSISVATWEKVE